VVVFVHVAEVLLEHDIDWCIHGDDLVTTADGEDCYAKVKAAGKFKYEEPVTRCSVTCTVWLTGNRCCVARSFALSVRHVVEPYLALAASRQRILLGACC
jgi:glycerol-3-phosphate cytidylyltransferase-like family protein